MEAVKEFLLENWWYILATVISLATLIVAICKGKKEGKSVKQVIVEYLTDKLPSYIKESEVKGGTGEQKKAYVLNCALRDASGQLGHQITLEEADFIVNAISPKIEDILSTPEKKLVVSGPSKGGTKHASKYRQ